MSVKRVYFVRHGETEGNVNKFYQFPSTPLTDVGVKGAQALAERFRNVVLEEIISSPFLRAQQTAKCISDVLGLPVTLYEDFHEVEHMQSVQGKSRETDEGKAYKKLQQESFTSIDWDKDGAENYFDVMKRVKSCVDMLEKNHNTNILVVSHGNFLRFLVAYLLLHKNESMEPIMSINDGLFSLSNVGITEFILEDNIWRLFTWNDHAHFAE